MRCRRLFSSVSNRAPLTLFQEDSHRPFALLFCDLLSKDPTDVTAILKKVRDTLSHELEKVEQGPLDERSVVHALDAAHHMLRKESDGSIISALLITETYPGSPFLLIAGVGDVRLYGILRDRAELAFTDPYHLELHSDNGVEERRKALQNALGLPRDIDIYCRRLSRDHYRYLVAASYGAYVQLSDEDWLQVDLALGTLDNLLMALLRRENEQGHLVEVDIIDPQLDLSTGGNEELNLDEELDESQEETPLSERVAQRKESDRSLPSPALIRKKRISRAVNTGIFAALAALSVVVWSEVRDRRKAPSPAQEGEVEPLQLSNSHFELPFQKHAIASQRELSPRADAESTHHPQGNGQRKGGASLFQVAEIQNQLEKRLNLSIEELATLNNCITQAKAIAANRGEATAEESHLLTDSLAELTAPLEHLSIQEALAESHGLLQEQRRALASAFEEAEAVWGETLPSSDGRHLSQILNSETQALAEVEQLKREQEELNAQIESFVVSRAREEVELQESRRRLESLEAALASEEQARRSLQETLGALRNSFRESEGAEEANADQVAQVESLIAEAEQQLRQKEEALVTQTQELEALYKAHDDLKSQYTRVATLSDERAEALAEEASRCYSLEQALVQERERRSELEELSARRSEQEQLLIHLRDAQVQLADQVERLHATSKSLEWEKGRLEQELQDLVAASRNKERALSELQQRNHDLATLVQERDAMIQVAKSRTDELKQLAAQREADLLKTEAEKREILALADERSSALSGLEQSKANWQEEQSQLERTLVQLSTENREMQQRISRLEGAEKSLATERQRRQESEKLYHELAQNIREQRKVIAEIDDSRKALASELEQMRNNHSTSLAQANPRSRHKEMPELSFDMSVKPTPKVKRVTTSQAPDSPASTCMHIVSEGDTLSGISQKYYGTARKWRDIAEANRDKVDDVNRVTVGTALVIP